MPQILQKAALEKPKEEDEALKQKAVTYIQFNDLADFEPEHAFHTDFDNFVSTQMQERISDPEQWHDQFTALDDMRRMNKHHTEKFHTIVPTYAQFLVNSVDNLRSGISKNSLMLLNEFFQQPTND